MGNQQPAPVGQSDQVANSIFRAWDRRLRFKVADTAVGVTAVCPLAANSHQMVGIAIVRVTDTNAALQGTIVYAFYFNDNTPTLNINALVGTDVTGGGAHLTAANGNTYVQWGSVGGIQAKGQSVAGQVGRTDIDFLVMDF